MEMYVMDALVTLRNIYNGNGSGYVIHLIYAFIEPLGNAKELDRSKAHICAITKKRDFGNDITGIEVRYMHETRKMFSSNKSDAVLSYPVLIALNKFVQERIDEGDIRIRKMFSGNKYKPIEKKEIVPLPINDNERMDLRIRYAGKIAMINSLQT